MTREVFSYLCFEQCSNRVAAREWAGQCHEAEESIAASNVGRVAVEGEAVCSGVVTTDIDGEVAVGMCQAMFRKPIVEQADQSTPPQNLIPEPPQLDRHITLPTDAY